MREFVVTTREKRRDGVIIREFQCPVCKTWGEIDDGQFHGRVSMYHDGCPFHETIAVCCEWQHSPTE